MLQGSSLVDANLTASTLSYARLEGASLSGAKAIGGSFLWAQAQGVDFTEADLSAASFLRTQLQGAILGSADISNVAFNQANLYRAFIDKDDLKKALVTRVRADNRFPKLALAKEDAPEKLDQTGYDRLLARAPEGVTGETRDLIIKRLKSLDPSKPADEDQFVSDKGLSWDKEKNDAIRKARFAKLAETMCDGANAPFDARGFIYNGRVLAAEMEGGQLIAKLRDVAHCPGAQGLNESDFREIMRLEAEAREFRKRREN
jgi:AcrR family transcriptional regulator